MKLATLSFVGLSTIALTACQEEPKPKYETIKAIEKSVVMPIGARPLSDYERFYSYGREHGHQVIWGFFYAKGMVPEAKDRFTLPGDPAPPSVHIVSARHMLIVSDGGCDHVGLMYDVSDRSLSIHCAGET